MLGRIINAKDEPTAQCSKKHISDRPDPPPLFTVAGGQHRDELLHAPPTVSTSPIGSPSMTSSLSAAGCPYGTAGAYAAYAVRPDQCPSMSSSIASLRLRAKQHSGGSRFRLGPIALRRLARGRRQRIWRLVSMRPVIGL